MEKQSSGKFGAIRKSAMKPLAMANGGKVKKCVTGGEIEGPGGPTDDMVPIMASNGEFMIKASSAKILGEDVLEALNDLGDEPKNPKDDAAEDAKEGEMKTGGMVRKMAIGGKVKTNDTTAFFAAATNPTGIDYAAETAKMDAEQAAQAQRTRQLGMQDAASQESQLMSMAQQMGKKGGGGGESAGGEGQIDTSGMSNYETGRAMQTQMNQASAQAKSQMSGMQSMTAPAGAATPTGGALGQAPQDPRLQGAPSGFMAGGGMVRKPVYMAGAGSVAQAVEDQKKQERPAVYADNFMNDAVNSVKSKMAEKGSNVQFLPSGQRNLTAEPPVAPIAVTPQPVAPAAQQPIQQPAATAQVAQQQISGFNPAKDSQKANYQAAGDAAYGYLPGESVLGKAGRNISNMANAAAGLFRKTANPGQQWVQPTSETPATSVQNTPAAAPATQTAPSTPPMPTMAAGYRGKGYSDQRDPSSTAAALNDPYSNAGIIAANPGGAVRKTVDANGRTSYSGNNVSGTVGFTDANGKALAGGPKGGFVMNGAKPQGMTRSKAQLEGDILQRQLAAQDEYLAAGDDPVKLKAAERKLMVLNGKKDQQDEYAYAPGGQVVIDGQIVTQPGVIFNKRTGAPVQQGQAAQPAAQPTYEVGKVYKDASGNRAKWNGKDFVPV